MLALILLVVALILFILAFVRAASPRFDLLAGGLAFVTAAMIVPLIP